MVCLPITQISRRPKCQNISQELKNLSRFLLDETETWTNRKGKINLSVNRLLLSESVLLLFAPHVHHLTVLIHLHGVAHQPVHVYELDALLLSIKQHWRDDGQLTHLLLCVLPIRIQ